MNRIIVTGGIALTILLGSLVPAGEALAQSYYRGYSSNLRLHSNRAANRAVLKKHKRDKKRHKRYVKKHRKVTKTSLRPSRRHHTRR